MGHSTSKRNKRPVLTDPRKIITKTNSVRQQAGDAYANLWSKRLRPTAVSFKDSKGMYLMKQRHVMRRRFR